MSPPCPIYDLICSTPLSYNEQQACDSTSSVLPQTITHLAQDRSVSTQQALTMLPPALSGSGTQLSDRQAWTWHTHVGCLSQRFGSFQLSDRQWGVPP